MSVLIFILSLVLLITLHELGHFFFAKKFDVKVKEFGIGIPPRIIGKKIGETIYSINALPLGGFVRMLGEDGQIEDERSFSEKPIWQRAIILVAGVASFWIIAVFIFAVVSFGWGIPTEITDDVDVESSFLMVNWVNPEGNFSESIQPNDNLKKVESTKINKVEDLEKLLKENPKTITIERGGELKEIALDNNETENFLEVVDVRRVVMQRSRPLSALSFGANQTINVTKLQAYGIGVAIKSTLTGEELPPEFQIGGPVMIGDMATDALDRGVGDYLYFVGIIATILAFMNILPIPALDGGRLLFLGIEKVKGSPIPERVERNVNAAFFVLLIVLMIVITARDIYNIF